MNRPQWVWLPEGEPAYMLECWLRALPAGSRVTLLAHPSQTVTARAIAAGTSGVLDIVRAEPGVPLPVPPGEGGESTITVPVSLDMVPMRYRPALMPAVPPHYPALHTIWQWGFRKIHFTGHAGGHVFSVPYLLDTFHNRHRGQRCFVVGNGPSLNDIEMAKLKGEITLGSNRCFLGYETWGFPFTYWGVYDKYQIEAYHHEYEARVPADTVKFFPAEYLPVLNVANGCPVDSVWPSRARRTFSAEPGHVSVGFTVTYMLLQIAACMGCDPVILVGADHRYELGRRGYARGLRGARRALARRLRGGRVYNAALAAHRAWKKSGGAAPGVPSLWSTEDAASPTHFTARYTAGGKHHFLPPEPEEAELDFDCAQAWAAAHGRAILNATPGTAMESFPKVDFTSLF